MLPSGSTRVRRPQRSRPRNSAETPLGVGAVCQVCTSSTKSTEKLGRDSGPGRHPDHCRPSSTKSTEKLGRDDVTMRVPIPEDARSSTKSTEKLGRDHFVAPRRAWFAGPQRSRPRNSAETRCWRAPVHELHHGSSTKSTEKLGRDELDRRIGFPVEIRPQRSRPRNSAET